VRRIAVSLIAAHMKRFVASPRPDAFIHPVKDR
jgi:hypothetical protein